MPFDRLRANGFPFKSVHGEIVEPQVSQQSFPLPKRPSCQNREQQGQVVVRACRYSGG